MVELCFMHINIASCIDIPSIDCRQYIYIYISKMAHMTYSTLTAIDQERNCCFYECIFCIDNIDIVNMNPVRDGRHEYEPC